MNQLESIVSVLKALKPELSAKYHVGNIGLFGSITRADFTDQSDIDIIVDFSKPIGIEFIDLANFLEATFKRKVDLVSRNGVKPNFFALIQKEILYI